MDGRPGDLVTLVVNGRRLAGQIVETGASSARLRFTLDAADQSVVEAAAHHLAA